jgi:hypothetical protein
MIIIRKIYRCLEKCLYSKYVTINEKANMNNGMKISKIGLVITNG